jgi:hypothetical protein
MRRRAFLYAFAAPLLFAADDDGTTTLTIQVNNTDGKPVDRASVIIKFKQGRSVRKLGKSVRKSWEARTNQEGWVKIPPIPQGDILIQIIAKGYQTYGDTLTIEEPEHTIDVKLARPVKQFSAHE